MTDVTDDVLAVFEIPAEPSLNGSSPVADDLIGESWQQRDIGPIVHGLVAGTITRPAPTVGWRDDGVALLYEGRVNGLYGESNAGKSFVALFMT
ncbi:MAG: hypothetical protein ACRDYC_05780, partial [Acidimicrobiales bacterium]